MHCTGAKEELLSVCLKCHLGLAFDFPNKPGLALQREQTLQLCLILACTSLDQSQVIQRLGSQAVIQWGCISFRVMSCALTAG